MTTNELKPSEEFITMLKPESAAAEAFKTLRTNLSLRSFDKDLQVINVISSTIGESKSTVVINLGYVYSQLRKKTLIIDLDLRKGSLTKRLSSRREPGLSNYLAGKTDNYKSLIKHNCITDGIDVLSGVVAIGTCIEIFFARTAKSTEVGVVEGNLAVFAFSD